MVGNVIDVRKNKESSNFISSQQTQDNAFLMQPVQLELKTQILINLYAEHQDSHHALLMNLRTRTTSTNALLANMPLKAVMLVLKMLITM